MYLIFAPIGSSIRHLRLRSTTTSCGFHILLRNWKHSLAWMWNGISERIITFHGPACRSATLGFTTGSLRDTTFGLTSAPIGEATILWTANAKMILPRTL